MFASLSAALRRLSSTQNDRSDSDGISQLQWIWFTSCPPFPSHFRTPNGGTLMDLVHLKCKLLITPLIWIEQYIYILIQESMYSQRGLSHIHPIKSESVVECPVCNVASASRRTAPSAVSSQQWPCPAPGRMHQTGHGRSANPGAAGLLNLRVGCLRQQSSWFIRTTWE